MKRSYIIIEPFMIDLELGQTELLIYAIIHHATKQQGHTNCSQEYLGIQIGKTRTMVNKAIKNLIYAGLISKQDSKQGINYTSVLAKQEQNYATITEINQLLPKITIDCEPQLTSQDLKMIVKEFKESDFLINTIKTLSQVQKLKHSIINGKYKILRYNRFTAFEVNQID